MVAAIVKIRGVPFCRPCRENYADELEVLAKVIEWHESHPVPKEREMERIPRFGETEMTIFSEPKAPPVVNRCICGCGAQVEKSGMLVDGHQAKVIPPPPVEEAPRRNPVSIYRKIPAKPRVVEPEPELEIADVLDKVLSEAGNPNTEDAMEEKICQGHGKRAGDCGRVLGAKNTTGLCNRCYASKKYAEVHGSKPRRAKRDAAQTPAVTDLVATISEAQLPAVTLLPTLAPRPNKIRFVLFEADVDAGNLSQLTDAISKALGVPRQ